MALGTFNRVVIHCSCRNNNAQSIVAFNGANSAEGAVGLPLADGLLNTEQHSQWNEMQDAIADGSADVYYYDSGTFIAYEDLPEANWILHSLHHFHPNDADPGLFAALATETEFERKGDGRPVMRLKGDISTPRYKPTSGTIHYHMRDWRAVPYITHQDRFLIQMEINKEREIINAADFRNMPEIRSLVHAMNSIISSGGNVEIPEYDDDPAPNYLLEATWTANTFGIPDADRAVAGTDLSCTIVDINTNRVSYGGNQVYDYFGLTCETNNAYDYNIKAINEWLQDYSPDVGNCRA